MFEDIQLLSGEGGFEAVREADQKLILIAGGRAGDDADRAAGMNE